MNPRPAAGLKLLLLAALALPFWSLGHPLWEVDDARYAEIPREMAERGDWVTPTLDYIDYVEKPPLIYWLGAVSYKLFGVSEASARLPLALLALLALAGTYWLGSWLFSPLAGIYGAVILGTCGEFSLLSHMITPDMAVTAFLLWASAFALRGLTFPKDARWAGPAAGAAMGLAFLSKGLIGLVFPAAWAAACAALRPELRRGVKPMLSSWMIPVCLLVSLPWVLAMESRHPGFAHFFFIEQQFQRYLTPKYNRTEPGWFFLGVDLAGLLPWTPLLLVSLFQAARGGRKESKGGKELLLWIGLVLGFFSASSSKLATYILPLFPHQCLLAGDWLTKIESDNAGVQWLRRLGAAFSALFFAALLASIAAMLLLPEPIERLRGLPWGAIGPASASLALLGAACLALATSGTGGQGRQPLLRAGWAACAVTGLLLFGAGRVTEFLSARDIAREIAANARPGDRVMTYGVYLHGIAFYAERPVDVVNWLGELHYGKRDPRFSARFGDDNAIKALPEAGHAAFVAARRRDLPYLYSLNKKAVKEMRGFGDWVLVRY